MTIVFNCPECNSVCAFKDIFAGRKAKCLKCKQVFIIPQNENEKVKKVEPPKEIEEPLPGFYEAIFKYSWRAIFNLQSCTILVFVCFLAILKFYTFHFNYVVSMPGFGLFLPVGWIIACLVFGGLFYCFAEIACSTAFDIEALPEIEFGGGLGYIATAFKSLYTFALALTISFIPAAIARGILSACGIESKFAIYPFIALASFLFPMAMMIVSISRDISLLGRPIYFLKPIIRAFRHYLFLSGMFMLGGYLQFASPIYRDVAGSSPLVIYLNLFAAIAIQIYAIVTVRAAGLFYRHFACYFKW